MTVKDVKSLLEGYPEDYEVVITSHNDKAALVVLSPEAHEKSKAGRSVYHVLSDRRK